MLTPLAADFQRRYPHITLDILPVPRFVSLSSARRTWPSPSSGRNAARISAPSCATTLMLYGAPAYLARHAPIRERA